MTKLETDDTKIALINNNIQYIQRDLADIKVSMKELSGTYVTSKTFADFINSDFANIKRIVYGSIALILTAFGLGVVNFFLKK